MLHTDSVTQALISPKLDSKTQFQNSIPKPFHHPPHSSRRHRGRRRDRLRRPAAARGEGPGVEFQHVNARRVMHGWHLGPGCVQCIHGRQGPLPCIVPCTVPGHQEVLGRDLRASCRSVCGVCCGNFYRLSCRLFYRLFYRFFCRLFCRLFYRLSCRLEDLHAYPDLSGAGGGALAAVPVLHRKIELNHRPNQTKPNRF